jgi:AraC-like DNA-binding protein
MPLIRHRPAAPLDRYVQCFWWSRRDEPQDFHEHILPSGGVQLLFALHECPITRSPAPPSQRRIEWSGGMVHGPQWSYYVAGPKPRGAIAGVAFRPGGAGAVLGLPVSELADQHVPVNALWGRPGQELHEQLMTAAEPSSLFDILEQSLSARIRHALFMHPAVAHALRACAPTGPPARVADVQQRAGYSPRHFIALFRSAVGLTPKHYYRVQRFNGVARRLVSGSDCDLADIAAAAGYSDHAHLTREFRELSGVAPTQYRPGGADRMLHHRARDALRPNLR